MFSQIANGAKSSAMLYSIVETAKANGLSLYDFIIYLIKQFIQTEQNFELLMPWNVNLG
jgi:transposase